MKARLYGIYAWLIVKAAFSIYYGVYFNVGVDMLLAVVSHTILVLCLEIYSQYPQQQP